MITADHDRHVAGRLESDAAGQRRIAIREACSSRDARLPGRGLPAIARVRTTMARQPVVAAGQGFLRLVTGTQMDPAGPQC
jgi:hypothetical protein